LEAGAAGGGEGGVPLQELFPRVGFIVTNFRTSSRAVVRCYNKRRTTEQWIKEGKQAVAMRRLSCHRFRANEVRLWLSVLAYNLGNLWRRLSLPARVANWSLTSLQQRRVKTGGRLIKHARYYWLLLAESHLTRRLFRGTLQRIVAPPVPGGQAAPGAQVRRVNYFCRSRQLFLPVSHQGL
jgi:Transposase DDE domain group 1